MRRVLCLGATKGMGRAVARALAARGDALCLLGRDAADLQRSAHDLEVGGAYGSVATVPCDLADAATFAPALDAAEQALPGFDTVVVTAGLFASQEELEADASRLQQLLQVNFTHTVLFCEQVRQRLLARGGGTLVVFSSVAGDRGRRPVVLYGASKAGLSAYLEGLDHRWHAQGLRVLCVKPGFVRTGMTAGLKPPPFAGEPEQVARDVLRALDGPTALLYTPRIWRWVMLVVRWLPRALMRRLAF